VGGYGDPTKYAPPVVEAGLTQGSQRASARRTPPPHGRRHRVTHRFFPLIVLAALAFVAGVLAGALRGTPEKDVAQRFATAWQRGDYGTMHRLIADDQRRAIPLDRFRGAYNTTAGLATTSGLTVGKAGDPQDGVVAIPVTVRTRLFGTVKRTLELSFKGEGDTARVNWTPALTFPGVKAGQQLERATKLPARANILANDGKVLAGGADRAPDPAVASAAEQVVGELGSIPPALAKDLQADGVPADAKVGTSGLELALQTELAGTPGGTLSVGGQVIARSSPRRARAVKTTIDPEIEEVTINAVAGQGSATVMRPKTGEILALVGAAYSGAGPPGSTFKIITASAALEAKKVSVKDEFPVETAAVLEGVRLNNASSESCGGTFEETFAHSCNSVYAPLGVKVGKEKLVEMAERYGFNRPLGIAGAVESKIPQPSGIGDDLDLGSTSIGQGKVVATTLELAVITATVANRGLLPRPTLLPTRRPRTTRVISPAIAAILTKFMIAVVNGGTGKNAQVGGVAVAGKTGTAELGGDIPNDAWFVAFAPARSNPQIAIAVTVPRGGSGGDAAAPIAQQVLSSVLKK